MEIIERALKSDSRLYESKPKPQDFILRVNGRHEYLWGKHAILLFRVRIHFTCRPETILPPDSIFRI